MDSNKTNDIKTKSKSLRKWMIVAAVVLSAAVLIAVGVAVFNNFISFPRIDKALANSLKAKLDLGTRFDVTDLFENGKIEISAEGTNEKDALDASVSYSDKGALGSIDLGDSHLDAVLTEKGIAASLSGVENGTRYGAYFEDITSTLETSFLNPQNKAENALKHKEYEKLLSLARSLEDKANADGEEKKDAIIVLVELAKVLKDCSLSDREISYDGITVNGEERKARTMTYAFGKADVIDFFDKLEALLNSPSDKFRGAMERLLENESLTKDIEKLGYELDTCEDLAKFIGGIKRLVNRIDEIAIRIEIAYVANAVSAIVLDCAIEDTANIKLLIDFGAKPKKDKAVHASLLIDQEHSKSQSQRRYTLDYSVKKVKKLSTVSAVYSGSTFIKDGELEQKDSSRHSFEMILDSKSGTADFALENNSDSFLNGEQNDCLSNSYAIKCAMEDRSSKLSFSLIGADGVSALEENVRLTFYKRPDDIALGEFTELLKMNVAEADKVASKAVDEFENIWNGIKAHVIILKGNDSE